MNASDDLTLSLVRRFPAPRWLVYEAWARKEHLDQWCVPKDFTIVDSAGDLRPGGLWRSHMRAPWGEDFPVGGIYRELVEGERLVFTHRWEEDDGSGHETVVAIALADAGNDTEMIFEQGTFRSKESRDSHAGGWSECFDHLAEYLETLVLREVTLVRELPTAPEVVFAAWTEPEQVAKWWGPRGFTNPDCEWEARPDGRIHVDMQSPEGTVYPMGGRFEAAVPYERLVFTSAALDDAGRPLFEVRQEIEFSSCAQGTRLRVHARVSELDEDALPYLSGMQEGWAQTLDRLGEFLTGQPVS